ncbi:hypothetical protein F8568_003970 [Actinomadura sp. LD22]|uniref:Uncharacterized protein n=1 Tax=Actinomadura physcomitrii TaxID=2650748 RepID=A0A6I4M5X7_9ACTN|nr:hypothetical protein [Actinomadura physcomitrii]MVZ99546.1 hypothetical protein [Actinomadura physcomitrii]
MIDDASRPAGPDDFIGALNALYDSCNRPPYRKLAEVSEHLGELYGRRDLPSLSTTGIFDVLAGRRKRLPSAAWVASFVLCCQRRAWQTGVRSDDPGTASLPGWQARLRAARSAVRDDVPSPRSADREAPERALAPPDGEPARPVRLTESQRATVAGYGPHGRGLLGRAAAGDADALYRVAVLLGTDPARGGEAVPLLIEAAAAGHPGALDLLDASPDGLDAREAACHAHHLGDRAGRSGDRAGGEVALVYYKAAVQGGRLDAAFAITEILRHADGSPGGRGPGG